MPSADSRIRGGLALRLAHSADPSALAPTYSCSSPYRVWLISGRDAVATNARDFVHPVFPVFRLIYSDSSLRDVAGLSR